MTPVSVALRALAALGPGFKTLRVGRAGWPPSEAVRQELHAVRAKLQGRFGVQQCVLAGEAEAAAVAAGAAGVGGQRVLVDADRVIGLEELERVLDMVCVAWWGRVSTARRRWLCWWAA